MQRFIIGTAETGGYPALSAHDFPQCAPTAVGITVPGIQTAANKLDKLIGQYGDEQMTVSPLFFTMKDGPKTQITLEAAKHSFEISEHPIGAP